MYTKLEIAVILKSCESLSEVHQAVKLFTYTMQYLIDYRATETVRLYSKLRTNQIIENIYKNEQ